MSDPNNPKLDAALKSIQPLRDLARNWDVDIASCLEDYLEEIIGDIDSKAQENDVSGEEEKPNFAQAALLLHNSSHVYSRKVEYLYGLVYAALDNLSSSSTSNSKNKSSKNKRVDPEIEEFENYDPHQQFLLLDDVLPTDEAGAKINLQDVVNPNVTSVSLENTRFSLGGMSVTAIGDKSGLNVAARNNFMATTLAGENSLRILQSTVNQSGILCMPGTANSQQYGQDDGTTQQKSPASPMRTDNDFGSGGDNDFGAETHDYGDDDNDGPGFDMGDSHDEPMTDVPAVLANAAEPTVTIKVSKKPTDPWAMLDPFDAEATKGRRLKIGTPFVLPPGLDQPPSACVTGARTVMSSHRRHQEVEPTPTFSIANAGFDATGSLPKGLAFGDEFAYIAKAAAKRKTAERREKRKLLKLNPHAVPAKEADELMGYQDANHFGNDDDDDDDSFGGGDDGGFGTFDDAYENSDPNTSNAETATFEALCRAHIQAFAKGAEKYKAETNLTKRVSDWQSKLEPLLDAEAERPEFDIHHYGNHVIQTIQESAQDTTSSGKKNSTTMVDFVTLTHDQESYEVCRLFLASLSLSNSKNVRFTDQEGIVMTPDTLQIELLNSTVDRPMEAYFAPSVMEGQL